MMNYLPRRPAPPVNPRFNRLDYLRGFAAKPPPVANDPNRPGANGNPLPNPLGIPGRQFGQGGVPQRVAPPGLSNFVRPIVRQPPGLLGPPTRGGPAGPPLGAPAGVIADRGYSDLSQQDIDWNSANGPALSRARTIDQQRAAPVDPRTGYQGGPRPVPGTPPPQQVPARPNHITAADIERYGPLGIPPAPPALPPKPRPRSGLDLLQYFRRGR